MDPAGHDLDRVFTIPNLLSVLRLGFLGGFVAVLFSANNRGWAFLLIAVAGCTDFFDGYIARRFNQISHLGEVLDPTVDRMVLVGAVIAMTVYRAVPLWLALVVLVRETAISSTAALLAFRGVARFEVKFVGKVATFGLMVGLPGLLLGDGLGTWAHAARVVAWIIVTPAVLCSYAAACAYVPQVRRSLLDRRTEMIGAAR